MSLLVCLHERWFQRIRMLCTISGKLLTFNGERRRTEETPATDH